MTQHGMRVLVVDDEASIAAVVRRGLESRGYEVETAPGGVEALRMFQRRPFEAVLTDLNMPGLDGQELVRRIKEAAPQTVVIVITGYASVGSAVEAMRAGCDDYLLKPVTDLTEIGRAIERCFARRAVLTRFMQGCRFDGMAGEDVRTLRRRSDGAGRAADLAAMTRPDAASDDEAPWTGPAGQAAGRVLIVDHDADFRDMLTWVFLDRGHEVAAAGSGRRALEMVADGDFDVVVTEYRLPDMGGAELLHGLRSARPGVPAVVVTSFAGCLDVRRMRSLGAIDVLTKPVRVAALLESVERAVAERARRSGPAARNAVPAGTGRTP